jgi:hypothetical protein
MDHTYIEEHHVADRYVQGTLPADEADRFENHYLSCPECLDRLDLAESLQRGFRRAATQAAVAHHLAILAWLSRLSRRGQAGTLLSAFLVVTILSAGLGFRANTHRDHQDLARMQASLAAERAAREQAGRQLALLQQPQANFPFLQLDRERGAETPGEGPTQRLIQPAEGQIVLVAQVDPPFAPSYRVRLLDGKGREIYGRQGLHPKEHDALTLSLPYSLLPPGDYTLAVDGITPGAQPADAGRFTFRMLR